MLFGCSLLTSSLYLFDAFTFPLQQSCASTTTPLDHCRPAYSIPRNEPSFLIRLSRGSPLDFRSRSSQKAFKTLSRWSFRYRIVAVLSSRQHRDRLMFLASIFSSRVTKSSAEYGANIGFENLLWSRGIMIGLVRCFGRVYRMQR